MLIYNGLKSDFMADTENDVLETKLYDTIKQKMNRSTGLSELNSWRNSLKEMYITLNDSAIPSDAGAVRTSSKMAAAIGRIMPSIKSTSMIIGLNTEKETFKVSVTMNSALNIWNMHCLPPMNSYLTPNASLWNQSHLFWN